MFICDISILNKNGKSLLDEELLPLGFNWHEMVALMVLEQVPGANHLFLGGFLQTDKANVTKLINKMEAEEYIERKENQKDKRHKSLFLTEKSKQVLPLLHHSLTAWENRCYEGLSAEEIRQYTELNKKVIENLMNTRR